MPTTKHNRPNKHPRIEAVDLFCGIGGLSFGMKTAGFNILAGFDLDHTCRYAFETNTGGTFVYEDVSSVKGKDIKRLYTQKAIKVLAGCAPCQPFSSYAFKNKNKDPNKYDLLYEFGRLACEVRPDIITMENVPAIRDFKLKPVLKDFVELLKNNGYHVWVDTVYCPNYGIPQNRKRLVLLASIFGDIELLPPTHTPDKYVTVRDTISHLPKLKAGETSKVDALHRCSALNQLNMKRIKATPEGGGWKSWPPELILNCHKTEKGRSYGSVYGRMRWDAPSPTMTTQCTGLGNGRFGHPEQDRAISAREAALLQTFPMQYSFFENEATVSVTKASRYIGNAVPPKLGEVIAKSIITHLQNLQ